MKNNAKSSLYFSAYPLKAIKAPEVSEPENPYLQSLLSGKKKTAGRLRVMPMANPYNTPFKRASFDLGLLPADIELFDKGWFRNYE
ncbi:MAG: hypothetical protein H7Y42_10545 [Chitinophagaceae bacterium]|nr:hypothetical protein [Chitinophagaceae bacterium]